MCIYIYIYTHYLSNQAWRRLSDHGVGRAPFLYGPPASDMCLALPPPSLQDATRLRDDPESVTRMLEGMGCSRALSLRSQIGVA